MNILTVKHRTVLVSMVLSVSSLIYCLATTTKVPIRITLKAPAWEIIVEINPQPPSHFHWRQDTTGVLIASDK